MSCLKYWKVSSDSYVCHVGIQLGCDPIEIDLLTHAHENRIPSEREIAHFVCLFVRFYCEIKTKWNLLFKRNKTCCFLYILFANQTFPPYQKQSSSEHLSWHIVIIIIIHHHHYWMNSSRRFKWHDFDVIYVLTRFPFIKALKSIYFWLFTHRGYD